MSFLHLAQYHLQVLYICMQDCAPMGIGLKSADNEMPKTYGENMTNRPNLSQYVCTVLN